MTQPPTMGSQLLQGIQTGVALMFVQTPFVTGFNRISVISCYKNLPMKSAAKQIYLGTSDSVNCASLKHFFKGISGHVVKESARVGFKASAIVTKPSLDLHFSDTPYAKLKSDLTFAGSLSFAEIVINPADTLRTMWQAGEKVADIPKGGLFSHLYRGSVANGIRQFGIWAGFPLSERIWSKGVETLTPFDPHSLLGISIKSLPQSFQITAPVWIFERVKNELQYHPSFSGKIKGSSQYKRAFQNILTNQGVAGLLRGFIPKVFSNAILVVGANYLLEQGRSIHK